ncbi:MAG: hypothetical protein ACE5ER_05805 [Nitrospinaceae bacterium]
MPVVRYGLMFMGVSRVGRDFQFDRVKMTVVPVGRQLIRVIVHIIQVKIVKGEQ